MKNRNLDHKDHWQTPPVTKAELNEEFDFDFDPCPLHADFDGLAIEWGERNYINPPYSRELKEAFILKAIEESEKGKLCVMLLPVSTSTKIFHKHIIPNMKEIRFVEKRLAFIGENDKGQLVNHHLTGGITDETIHYIYTDKNGEEAVKEIPLHVKNSGQHDSMIIIFDGR